jgi:hypothetical protein
MRKLVSFVGGALIGGVVFGAAGIFLGHYVSHSDEPVVVVRNVTHSSIPNLRIETDVGESYDIHDLRPNQSRNIRISGRDKALWILASMPSGKTNSSEHIYVTSRGAVFGVVSEDSVTIDYKL